MVGLCVPEPVGLTVLVQTMTRALKTCHSSPILLLPVFKEGGWSWIGVSVR